MTAIFISEDKGKKTHKQTKTNIATLSPSLRDAILEYLCKNDRAVIVGHNGYKSSPTVKWCYGTIVELF